MKTSIITLCACALTVTVTLDISSAIEGRNNVGHILESGQEIEENNDPPIVSIAKVSPLIGRKNGDYNSQPFGYSNSRRAYYDSSSPTQIRTSSKVEDTDGRLFSEPQFLESRPQIPQIQSRYGEPLNDPIKIQPPIPINNHRTSQPVPVSSTNQQSVCDTCHVHVRPQHTRNPAFKDHSDRDSDREHGRSIGVGYPSNQNHAHTFYRPNVGSESEYIPHVHQEASVQGQVPPPFPYYLGWGREREYLRQRDFGPPDYMGPTDYRGTRTRTGPQIFGRS